MINRNPFLDIAIWIDLFK